MFVPGNFTELAGSQTVPGSFDGIGSSASFNSPKGIAIDSNGEFALIADMGRVRMIDISSRTVSTLAGSGAFGSLDGIGTDATFNTLYGVTIDSSNSFALVSDSGAHRIRRIDLATVAVTTLAGSSSGSLDTVGISASFNSPLGIALDSTGAFALVADSGNHRIRRIEISTGAVSTLAGFSLGSSNGAGTSASFNSPSAVAIDRLGVFALVADTSNNLIRRIQIATGVVTSLAGSSSFGFSGGIGTLASFNSPKGIAIDASNNVALVADYGNSAIRHIVLVNASVTSFAGLSLSPQYVATSPTGSIVLLSDYSPASVGSRIRVSLFSSICNSGSYCPASSPSASSQIPCNAGHYCPAGSSSATQMVCPGGYYCPAGTPSKLICNAGIYCPPGSVSIAAPLNCSAGYYCPAGSSSATQKLCTAGFYCPVGSPIMLVCSAGYYCPAGSSSATQAMCSAGYFCPVGSSNSTGLLGTSSLFSFQFLILIFSIKLSVMYSWRFFNRGWWYNFN
jgi:DNA-binding beta-propeller fold protein YncE